MWDRDGSTQITVKYVSFKAAAICHQIMAILIDVSSCHCTSFRVQIDNCKLQHSPSFYYEVSKEGVQIPDAHIRTSSWIQMWLPNIQMALSPFSLTSNTDGIIMECNAFLSILRKTSEFDVLQFWTAAMKHLYAVQMPSKRFHNRIILGIRQCEVLFCSEIL